MRRLATASLAVLGLVQMSPASEPVLHDLGLGGSGGDGPRDVCWEQFYDCEGAVVSSEVSSSVSILTEVAHDFGIVCVVHPTITELIWWGRSRSDSWPGTPCFNIFFYTDNGACCPDEVFAAYFHVTPNVTDVCDSDARQYEAYVNVDVAGYTRYWVVFQANSHGRPPHWGILQSTPVYHCMSMFRSAHFGYPDWVPLEEVIGHPFDGAFVVYCDCPARTTRTQSTTWGALKTLFE